jgi:hypothetical protein
MHPCVSLRSQRNINGTQRRFCLGESIVLAKLHILLSIMEEMEILPVEKPVMGVPMYT